MKPDVARALKEKHGEIENLKMQLRVAENAIKALESEKDSLEFKVGRVSAATTRVRESYLKRLDQQTKSTLTLSDTVTSVLGAMKEISISYREMLKAVHSVGDICRGLSDSFQVQVQTQNSMVTQTEAADQTSEKEVLKAQALKNDLGQFQAIRNFMAGAVDTIDEVSAQLSLLSMNGRIEAAHAGVVGRGFAVVAQEMLKLQQESQRVIATQRIQLGEFLPLMAAMQEKSDAVETQAREKQIAIRGIAAGSQILHDQTRTNLEHISGLTSAVEELAASIEQGERTTQVIDRETSSVESIFKEEVFVAQKMNNLDKFLFDLTKNAHNLAEASHKIINEYQKISVLNGVSYVWQGECWLVTDLERLPAHLRSRVPGPRVLVCIGQTENNRRFAQPLDPDFGILEIRPLDDIWDKANPLQELQVFLDQAQLTAEMVKFPGRISNPARHATMVASDELKGSVQKVLADSIRRGNLVSSFTFGGAFSNGDLLMNYFLSTYKRTPADAAKFSIIGESLIMSLQNFVDTGAYWLR